MSGREGEQGGTGAGRRPVALIVGAGLWGLWGVLHVWVGAEGLRRFGDGAAAMWDLLLGGPRGVRAAFQHATDAMTADVHAHLLLNFCIDVAGYGVLGLLIAWALVKRPAWGWPAYALGVVVIGIGDLAYLFAQVVPGISAPGVETLGGPALWFLAVVVTPLGLRSWARGAEARAEARA